MQCVPVYVIRRQMELWTVSAWPLPAPSTAGAPCWLWAATMAASSSGTSSHVALPKSSAHTSTRSALYGEIHKMCNLIYSYTTDMSVWMQLNSSSGITFTVFFFLHITDQGSHLQALLTFAMSCIWQDKTWQNVVFLNSLSQIFLFEENWDSHFPSLTLYAISSMILHE